MGSLSIVFGALVLCAPLLALGVAPRSGCEGSECETHVGSLMQRTATKTASDKSAAEIISTSNEEDEDEDDGEDEGEEEDEHEDELDEVNEASRQLLSARRTASGNCEAKKSNKGSACGSSCKSDQNCYAYSKASSDLYGGSSLVGTGKQRQTALEIRGASGGSRRRRCYHLVSSDTGTTACPERCNMAENRACDSQTSILSGEACSPNCVNGYSLPFDSQVPSSLTCTTGTLSPLPEYQCLHNAVTGSLTVKVVNAVNLEDEDWWAGESDAYVMLHLGRNKCESSGESNCRTATIGNNDNPSWNAEFHFPISSRADKLTLDVYDQDDAAFDDLLGRKVGMDLREIIQHGGQTYAKALDLHGEGKLNVELTFTAD